jgi:putative spermidine/putrescine transport system permease protein
VRHWNRAILLIAAWTILLYLVIPNIVVMRVSFTPTSFFSIPGATEWSLRHYEALAAEPKWYKAAISSLTVAVGAAAIATFVGAIAAFGMWRLKSNIGGLIQIFALGPLIVPSIVIGLAFYWVWGDLGWRDSIPGLMLAHAILGVPYVVIAVTAALSNMDPRIEQASRSLGANTRQTFTWVILPNIRVGLFAGALLAFHLSWDEVIVTLFLTARRVQTLPRLLLDAVQNDLNPVVASVATILMALTMLASLGYMAARLRKIRA